jgi:hypothetical protein
MVAGLQFLWFLNGFAWRSAVVLHDVDDAAKRDPSVGLRQRLAGCPAPPKYGE